ncbi:hypothetical protein [Streptomyces sp. NPDC051657]
MIADRSRAGRGLGAAFASDLVRTLFRRFREAERVAAGSREHESRPIT